MEIIENPIEENEEPEENPLGFETETLIVAGAVIGTHLIAEYAMTQWEQGRYEAYVADDQNVGDVEGAIPEGEARVRTSMDKIVPTVVEAVAGIGMFVGAYFVQKNASGPYWLGKAMIGVGTGLIVASATNLIEIMHTRQVQEDEWNSVAKMLENTE